MKGPPRVSRTPRLPKGLVLSTGEDPRNADNSPDVADEALAPDASGSEIVSPPVGQPDTSRSGGSLPRSPSATVGERGSSDGAVYAALDLGTNNCPLLIATPRDRGFCVVDAFSRILRLGGG